jgi:tetratricopeptide (TPR) repeat protein
MNGPQPNRVRCEAHGLMYDPTAHSGCVVCRREEQPSEPQRTGPPSTKVLALTKSLAALALVVFVGGVYVYLDRQQAIVEADGPTEPEVGRVVAALPGIPEHKGTIMLGRTGVDQYGYPRDQPDQLTLMALLRDKRFEELSSHLESFQASFEDDFRKEQWPTIAFSAFNIADRELGPLIDEWVKTTPDSFAPYQARAEHRVALAWHYRGDKVGRLTSKKRFKRMRKTLASVPADLERALELRPRLDEARTTQLTLANAFGLDINAKTKILEAGLRDCPYCFGIRVVYLGSIAPRWGGSRELMERKAADWQYTDKNPKLRQLLGFSDFDRCELLTDRQPAKALALCNRAIDSGAFAPFLAAKGLALVKLERYDDAVQALTEAVDIVPQHVEFLNLRGYALLKAERYDEAARDLVLATRLDPVHERAEGHLHHILAKLVRLAFEQGKAGKVDDAIAEYTRVLRMHPRYAHAFLYRGDAYDRKGQLKLAEQDYLRAIELDPTNIEAYRGLDHVLFRQKRLDEIVELWNGYLRRKPKDAAALFERSGTYYHKGQLKLAKRDVAAACRLGHEKACATEARFSQAR